jgi:hypothetical protein
LRRIGTFEYVAPREILRLELINESGNPILIEANLCRGGIDLLQLSNGPLFGEDTKAILDEVFGK